MKRIGILGGGQLARMLALAGHPLGFEFRIFDPAPDAPARAVAEHVCAPWDDEKAITRFCSDLDVATLEIEALPLRTARAIASRVPLYPTPRALAATQDRLAEKEFARSLDIATAPFARIDHLSGIGAALERVGAPAILKQRTNGYDGRGQLAVLNAGGAKWAWERGGRRPGVLEGFVPFDRELSLVSVRDRQGRIVHYPLAENLHRGGVLQRTIAPAAGVSATLERDARGVSVKALEALDYVGALTLEFFEVGGRLLLNEFAPRVHNSGHWTIEGAVTSQFENHIRAVAGLPLGSTEPRGRSVLRNILGRLPDAGEVLSIPGAHLHLYGKQPRDGRKLGHVTLTAATDETLARNERALSLCMGEDGAVLQGRPPAVVAPAGEAS